MSVYRHLTFPPHVFEEDPSTNRAWCKTCHRFESHPVHEPISDDLTQEELLQKLSEPFDSDWTADELDDRPLDDGWVEVGQIASGGMISYKRYMLHTISYHAREAHGFVIRFNSSKEAIKEYNYSQIEFPWASIVALKFRDNSPEVKAEIKAWEKRQGMDI